MSDRVTIDIKHIPDDATSPKDIELEVSDCQCCDWKHLRGLACPLCGTNHTTKYPHGWTCLHCGVRFTQNTEEKDRERLDGRAKDVIEFLESVYEDKVED